MKFYALTPLVLQKLIWIPTRLILSIFCHLEVRGLENLKDVRGPVIFACNHTSEMDPILIPASLPFWSKFSPMFYTSRESKFYVNSGWRKHFYGGWFFKLWGSYPVFTGLRDYERSLRHHIEIIDDRNSICVFPEGGITPDGHPQIARGGVAYLAERTQCPIVPVGISDAWHMSFHEFLFGRRHVAVHFGVPIYQGDLKSHNMAASIPSDIKKYKIEAGYVMQEVVKNID